MGVYWATEGTGVYTMATQLASLIGGLGRTVASASIFAKDASKRSVACHSAAWQLRHLLDRMKHNAEETDEIKVFLRAMLLRYHKAYLPAEAAFIAQCSDGQLVRLTLGVAGVLLFDMQCESMPEPPEETRHAYHCIGLCCEEYSRRKAEPKPEAALATKATPARPAYLRVVG